MSFFHEELSRFLEETTDLERKFHTAFSEEEFASLGLSRYFPRIYRGLPRMYPRGNPSTYQIKPSFTHLSSLISHSLDRLVCSFYTPSMTSSSMKIIIFSYVMTDGFGDWTAGIKVAKILQAHFPQHSLELIALSAFELEPPPDLSVSWILYQEKPTLDIIPADILQKLKEADWVLQFPTHFLEGLPEGSQGRFDSIGEYGYLESASFDPQKGFRSMGLHVLEKGLFVEPIKDHQPLDSKALFYFAYLFSPLGGRVYLRALLESLVDDERDIDLCTPSLDWFIKGASSLFPTTSFNIKRLEVHFKDFVSSTQLASVGKVVRILCKGRLSPEEVERFIALSLPFVGVRGNQSLSEAISYGQVFFFDARLHNRFLIKDLLSLAENRLPHFKGTLTCLRMMREVLFHQLTKEEGDFVDELFFQGPQLDEAQIATNIALALRDPRTLLGYQKLGEIIRKEYSFNEFLVGFTARALRKRLNPELELKEQTLIEQVSLGEISLRDLIEGLK